MAHVDEAHARVPKMRAAGPGLTNIHHRKDYEANRTEAARLSPDLHLRGPGLSTEGVAGIALRGALDLITQAGGGVVEGYPQDTRGKRISATFLYNNTRSGYEQNGFTYLRPMGKSRCEMRRNVSPTGWS